MNGVYLQLHAYMLRIAIPYGTLSSEQMRMLAHVARRYDRGYGHFTTRQNIQFNWIKLEEMPDTLADLASVEHARHADLAAIACATSPPTSGRAWRPTRSRTRASGRSWCASIRRCIPNSPSCRASSRSRSPPPRTTAPRSRSTTSACACIRNGAGEVGFEVMVGGGLGRTPFIGKTIKPFLPKRDLLSYVEAILRVYNQYGRRDNIYKARIKILVHELGAEKFAAEVENEWSAIKDGALALDPAVVADVAARFTYPDYERLDDNPPALARARKEDRALRRLARQFRRQPQAARLRHRHAVAQADRRRRPATPPPSRWTPSPTSPTATASARSASATSRTWCCRMSPQRDLPALWQKLEAHRACDAECRACLRHHRLSRASTIAASPMRARSRLRRN